MLVRLVRMSIVLHCGHRGIPQPKDGQVAWPRVDVLGVHSLDE
jgi:hypothetical protein